MSNLKGEQALKDAIKFVKEGESQFKGGFFRKPDYSDAGGQFCRAAEIYIQNKKYPEAKTYFEKSGISYDKAMVLLKSANMFAQASQSSFMLNDFKESYRLIQEAKMRFLEGNQGLQAIRQIKDLAQKIRPSDPLLAYDLYDQALTLVENENQYHWEKDTFIDFSILCLEMDKFPETFQAWERAAKAFISLKNYDTAAHCIVSIIIIHLKRGDIVAAERIFEENIQHDYFIRTDDFTMIDFLIRGVKNHDGDLILLAQKNLIVQFLKPEIGRMIFEFKAPKSNPQPSNENKDFNNNKENNNQEEENIDDENIIL